MKRTHLIPLLCIPLLLTSCSALPGTKPQTQSTDQNTSGTTQNTTAQNQQSTGTNSIADLIKNAVSAGTAVKCTYKDKDQGEVTTYVKGNKMKAEGIEYFSTKTEGNKEKGGMINDGEWLYIWGGDDKSGMKFKLSDMQEVAKEQGQNMEEYQNPEKWAEIVNKEFQVDCKPAVITDSQFTPPTDVKFEDMAALIEFAKQMQNAKPSDLENIPGNLPGMGDNPLPDDTQAEE